tara:strand:- start:225 stop:440 length:216 start_codon:yes stop_codon:yes gene_type:complete
MSKKGAYIGGHTLLTIKKKNKSKVSIGSISKAKNRWPYKTIKPDHESVSLNKSEKLLLERRRIKKTNDLKK